MKKFWDRVTGRTSGREAEDGTGMTPAFSRSCGPSVPRRQDGLPSPNSRAGEIVRRFLAPKVSGGGTLMDLANSLDRGYSRIYREAEGEAVLSWDFVDRAGAELELADRLALGRYLMDRWGLRAEVGPLPKLEEGS